jgi:DNA (cytosine-5)-methyltransferase 1
MRPIAFDATSAGSNIYVCSAEAYSVVANSRASAQSQLRLGLRQILFRPSHGQISGLTGASPINKGRISARAPPRGHLLGAHLDLIPAVGYSLIIDRMLMVELRAENPRRSTARRPIAIDLFSGCGGLTQGLRRAGFNVVGAVEIDALAVETYRLNHRRVKVWSSDIQKLPVRRMMRALGIKRGELDLLAGCPPCEGFSSMRTLNGSQPVQDKRNDLIFQFLRFVRKLRPKAIMLENVPDLRKDGRFSRFCAELKLLGYDADNFDVLDASNYGVGQRRRRLILLAGLNGHIDFAPKQTSKVTVQEVISGLPVAGTSGDPLHDVPEKRHPRIFDMIKCIPVDGGSRSQLGESRQLQCHRNFNGFKDVYGRMAWGKPSPTITGGCVNPSKGRFLHPVEHRTITLREAALLQGFPLNYKFSLRRGKFLAAEMIGNALPPDFIRCHARQVLKFLNNRHAVIS